MTDIELIETELLKVGVDVETVNCMIETARSSSEDFMVVIERLVSIYMETGVQMHHISRLKEYSQVNYGNGRSRIISYTYMYN